MNDQNLVEALQQIKLIVERCLSKQTPRTRAPKGRQTANAQSPSARGSLPEHIITLRDRGFFSAPKTYQEVHAKLQEKYHCDVGRVAVALLRVRERKELRKTSKAIDGKWHTAYVW